MSSRPVTRSQVSTSATLPAVMITRSRASARARSSTTATAAADPRPTKRTRTTNAEASANANATATASPSTTRSATAAAAGAGAGEGVGCEKKKEPHRGDDAIAKESVHVHDLDLEDVDGDAAMSSNMKASNNNKKKSSKKKKKMKSSDKNNNNNNKNNNTSKKTLIKTESTSHQQTNAVEEKKQISDLVSLHDVSLPVNGSSREALISALTSHGGVATSAIVDDLISILLSFDRISQPYPHPSIPRAGIAHTLKIIHESTLMIRYEQARRTMTERAIPFTERIMFHGTTPYARQQICKQGFEHQYSNAPGVWVAESVHAWNHQQGRDPGTRQLLACRVLIPSVHYPHNQRFSDSDEQPFAHLQTGPITVVTHTHCVVPCAIVSF